MATYIYQVTSASATAATDLVVGLGGIAATGDISTRTAVTNLTWAIAAYDASGRAFVVGSVRSSASFVNGTDQGMLSFGVATASNPSVGSGRYFPLTMDNAGNLRVTLSAGSITAFVSGTATVSGNVSAFIASANLTGLSAVFVTASGQVSAIQGTSPWVVSANNLLTVSAGITGGSLGITGGSLSAVTAMLTSGLQAFTSGSATANTHQGHMRWGLVDAAGTSGVNSSIDGKYGWFTVNASGHAYVKVTGTALVSATNLLTVSAGVTGGSIGITGGGGLTGLAGTANIQGTAYVTASGQVTATAKISAWGASAVSNATAITAGMGLNWSTPIVGAIPVGYRSDGTSNYDPAGLAKLFDLDTGGNVENVLGITIRAATAGGSNPVAVVDNTAFSDGTTGLLPAGYILDESAGTALSENDAAAARVDSKRAQVFVIEDETTRGRRGAVTIGKAQLVEQYFISAVSSFAGSATGGTVDMTPNPAKYFGLQVLTAGASASNTTAVLQWSLDGSTFQSFLTSMPSGVSFITGTTGTVWPALYWRMVFLQSSANASATATAVAMN